MSRILMCIFYICLFLSLFVEKAQTVRKNIPPKDTQQLEAWNRATRQGEEDDAPTSTTSKPETICSCSKIYDPVCASNGRSYYNLCQLECDSAIDVNVTVVHQGNCIPF